MYHDINFTEFCFNSICLSRAIGEAKDRGADFRKLVLAAMAKEALVTKPPQVDSGDQSAEVCPLTLYAFCHFTSHVLCLLSLYK